MLETTIAITVKLLKLDGGYFDQPRRWHVGLRSHVDEIPCSFPVKQGIRVSAYIYRYIFLLEQVDSPFLLMTLVARQRVLDRLCGL